MSESINTDLQSNSGGSISNLSVISDGSTGTGKSTTNTNTSTNTSVSSKTSGSGLPRPSGLKVPNKSNRICGGAQKPPVPVSPKSYGTNACLRKLTDEFAKKKISNTDGTNSCIKKLTDELAKKKISNAVGSESNTPGWADVRKLSEAGVRRSSDSSIVLTEDTDSFIIGERVWVGGNKPGQIAYIGETQFAPGDWAGIVLDQPIGKNDGSVGGVRYFQCENKKGIFSRLTRLTRSPISGTDNDNMEKSNVASGSFNQVTPQTAGRNSVSSTTSPVSKSSTSSSASKVSDLKIGDRVIIMSSMGSKAGILRYIGTTNFALGEWCGVELDDPLGKNDGSVSGTRYFDCLPNFGLFAPLHKVSKSPTGILKTSTVSCAMHPTGSGSGKKLHLGSSRESLNSAVSNATLASSIKSNTSRKPSILKASPVPIATSEGHNKGSLQELLKQKQQHIEQLLKERDLERAEVTRAASQAEQAEHDLAMFKQDFIQFKDETAAKNNDYELIISELQNEKQDLVSTLEDERRRYEDLQFRYEEEVILKSDLETKLSKNDVRLKELELQDRTNQEALEIESNKLFEAEEALTKLKEELEKNTIAQNKIKVSEIEMSVKYSHLEEENVKLNKKVTELLEINKINNEKFESDKKKFNDEINKLKSELEVSTNTCKEFEEKYKNSLSENCDKEVKLTEDNIKYKKIIEELNEKINLAEKSIAEKESVINNLKESKDNILKEMKTQLEKESIRFIDKEKQFTKELMDLENILKEKETEINTLKKNKIDIETTLTKKINDLSLEFNLKCKKLEEEKSSCFNVIDNLKSTVAEIQKEKNKIEALSKLSSDEFKEEFDKIKTDLSRTQSNYLSEKESLLKEIFMKDSELLQLKTSLEKITKDYDLLKLKFEDLNNEIDSSAKELSNKLKESIDERKQLTDYITSKNEEIKSLKTNISHDQDEIKLLTSNLENSIKKMNEMQLMVSDLTCQLAASTEKCSQLTLQKQNLEDNISSLMNTSSDSSAQLSKLNDELRIKEDEIEKLREKLNEQLRISKNNEQQMNHKFVEMISELDKSNKNVAKLENELKNKNESIDRLKSDLDNLTKKENDLALKLDNSFSEIQDCNKQIIYKDDEIQKLNEELQEAIKLGIQLKQKLEEKEKSFQAMGIDKQSKQNDLEIQCNDKSKEIEKLKTENSKLEQLLKNTEINLLKKDKKLKEIIDLNIKIEENFIIEKKAIEDEIRILSNELKNTKESLDKKKSAVLEITKERDSLKEENLKINKQLEEKENKLVNITNELGRIKESLSITEKYYDEIKSKLNDDYSSLQKEKDKIEKLFIGKEFELNKVLSEIEILKEERKNFEKSIIDKELKINEQHKQIEILNNDISRLKEEINYLSNSKIEIEEKLKTSSTEIDVLKKNEVALFDKSNAELIKYKIENALLVQQLKDTEEKLSALDKSFNSKLFKR